MADSEFTPAALDQIEDALELLEGEANLEGYDPPIRERLVDYRELLVASREALPLVEPPPIAAEELLARAAGPEHTTTGAEVLAPLEPAEPPTKPHLWTRIRKTLLLPGFAVAATAAFVLIFVKPVADDAEPQAVATAPATDLEVERRDVTTKRPAAASAPARVEPNAAPATPPSAEAPADHATADSVIEGLDRKGSLRSREESSSLKKSDAPSEDDEAEPEPQGLGGYSEADQKDTNQLPRWDVISLGDRARRGGNCTQARFEYRKAIDDADPRVQARALAGLGLCQWGDPAAAEKLYKRARVLDPEIDTWIEGQPKTGAKPGRAKAARKSKPRARPAKKSKAAPSSVQQKLQ